MHKTANVEGVESHPKDTYRNRKQGDTPLGNREAEREGAGARGEGGKGPSLQRFARSAAPRQGEDNKRGSAREES